MKMYKVEYAWLGPAYITELDVKKVSEKSVLTDKGVRYLKKCQSYELFDSIDMAKNRAIDHTESHIKHLKARLSESVERLNKLNEY